jgi:transposase
LRLPFEDDFLVKDINPVSISTSGYIRPTITIERLGSNLAPRYRSKQEKTTTTKKKKKTTLPTYSPTKLPTPRTSKHHKRRRSMTSKATLSRRKQRRCRRRRSSEDSEKCFHLEDTNQSRKHPNTPPPRRAATPEDATDVDTGTTTGKAFARCFVDADPMPSGKMNHHTGHNHQCEG